MWALDARTGRTIWRRKPARAAIKGAIAISDGQLYVGSYDGHLYCLGAQKGRLIWKAKAQSRLYGRTRFYSTPAVAYGRVYIGSTDVDLYLPGFRAANDLVLNHPMFRASPPLVGAWIGNRTTALAHHDMSHNVACVAVGRRRFTLFPPEQVENLYPGPLEPTPGGQVVTMTDINAPDFTRFPKLREALAAAQVADMEPGDALFYPALWWHQVEALESFNVMINYWWNTSPGYMDTPQTTLLHALLSLRDRSDQEKRAWRAMFDYLSRHDINAWRHAYLAALAAA